MSKQKGTCYIVIIFKPNIPKVIIFFYFTVVRQKTEQLEKTLSGSQIITKIIKYLMEKIRSPNADINQTNKNKQKLINLHENTRVWSMKLIKAPKFRSSKPKYRKLLRKFNGHNSKIG